MQLRRSNLAEAHALPRPAPPSRFFFFSWMCSFLEEVQYLPGLFVAFSKALLVTGVFCEATRVNRTQRGGKWRRSMVEDESDLPQCGSSPR